MGLPKRRPEIHPDKRVMQAWIKQATPPKRDETDAIELAREFGADIDDVLELVEERRSIRQYEGNLSQADADRLGLDDARDILAARPRRCAND